MGRKKLDPNISKLREFLKKIAQKEEFEGIVPAEGLIPPFLLPAYCVIRRRYARMKRREQAKVAARERSRQAYNRKLLRQLYEDTLKRFDGNLPPDTADIFRKRGLIK